MTLTNRQRIFIEKHKFTMSVPGMARALGLTETAVNSYLSSGSHVTRSHPELTVSGRSGKRDFEFMKWFRSSWHILAGLIITVSVIYANSINNVFISDDLTYMVNNPKLNSPAFFQDYPVTIVKALINWTTNQIFGLTPPPFHIINIILHAAVACLFFLILSIIAGRRIAIIGAFLWAVHPILTESVTWIGGGGYILYTFFFFLSFIFYLLSPKNKFLYPLSLAIFALMLGSSEKSIPLFIIFFIYEFCFGNLKHNWKRLMPYLILTFLWVGLILGVMGFAQSRLTALQTQYYMPKGLDNPLIQIPVAIMTYIHLIFWPDKLSFYQSGFIYTPLEYAFLNISFIIILILSVYGFFRWKYFFFWISLLFISLATSLSPFRLSWWVAERYVYLGSAGVIAIISYLLAKISNFRRLRIPVFIFVGLSVIALMTRTVIRNADWRTADALWIATGKTAPLDPKTHNNLGDYWARQGNLEKAAEEFTIATQLQSNYADAYHNLAVVYMDMDKQDKAIENLNTALSINPRIWQSYLILAIIYHKNKQYDQALSQVQMAYQIAPDDVTVLTLLGTVKRDMGDIDGAKNAFNEALRLKPDNKEARALLDQLGR
jgi:tetratricopeptide (TPR) repeat protein